MLNDQRRRSVVAKRSSASSGETLQNKNKYKAWLRHELYYCSLDFSLVYKV